MLYEVITLFGARLTNKELKAGNMVPNPTPSNRAITKNKTVVNSGFHFINVPHKLSEKKQKQTKYRPNMMICVMRPLSTCFPEKRRETAMPKAMNVKNNPELNVIPIFSAYMAT